jgi:hypothetical protein
MKQYDPYRTLTTSAVLLVAAFAAIISFEHISDLAITYGQARLTAYLMPLSVDGLVTVSSLAMLRSARARLTTPRLARIGLTLAIIATLGANVLSGVRHGVIGALIAGWPAVAFVISAEIAIGMVRRSRRDTAVSAAKDTSGKHEASEDAKIIVNDINPGGRDARRVSQDLTALAALSADPDMSFDKLAELLGTSERTARRVRARVADRLPSVNGHDRNSGQRHSMNGREHVTAPQRPMESG